ncbi:MAG TPA: sodium/glutamate symporter [Vicinamibacterales bacterium]|nr:sodium/glutamate symporter [Vicinamibacterales bacterium]
MKPIQLDLLSTILIAFLVLFAGRALIARSAFLARFSIPAPVVGGVITAILLAVLDVAGGIKVGFDMALRDNLLLMFFTTVGLSADARMLARGGPKLIVFLLVSIVFIAIQNFVGIAAAVAMDLHPAVGLLGGSITLTGGHGTGAAYGGRFGDTMNIAGAMELTMACATAGLVLGSLLGGPLAEYLVRRHRLKPSAAATAAAEHADAGDDPITSQSVLNTLFAILACLAAGKMIARAFQGTGLILPDFLFCLLLGVAIRNAASFIPPIRVSNATVDLLGSVALSLFLVMALMGMRLVDLVSLAGPLLLILTLQVIAMALFAAFVTFRVMGRDYDAAILSAGHVGFALSSTAAALAIMKAVTERRGPSPLAFVIVPMVGAFFIDIANALLIQGYLALPLFGFPS